VYSFVFLFNVVRFRFIIPLTLRRVNFKDRNALHGRIPFTVIFEIASEFQNVPVCSKISRFAVRSHSTDTESGNVGCVHTPSDCCTFEFYKSWNGET